MQKIYTVLMVLSSMFLVSCSSSDMSSTTVIQSHPVSPTVTLSGGTRDVTQHTETSLYSGNGNRN